MRLGPVLLTLLVACSSGTKGGATPSDAPNVDGADAGGGDADTDADADADTDADADADSDPYTATSDTASPPCANPVIEQFPADNEVDVYVGSEVFFTLTDPDPTATIAVTDPAGALVYGGSTVTDTLVRWTGGPLTTNTGYDATLVHSCGVETVHFETSDVGEDPLAVDPTGWPYAIDLGTGVWAQPVGLGSVLASLLSSQQLMLSPTAIGSYTIDFLGAIGEGDVQDVCVPTVPMPQSTWSDPTFTLVAPMFQLDIGGLLVDVTDIDVEGSFAADGMRIQFGTLDAVIDTRHLGPAIGLSSAYGEVCDLVYSLGISCDVCADGQAYCLTVSVHDLEAPYIGGTLTPRTASDIVADPACN